MDTDRDRHSPIAPKQPESDELEPEPCWDCLTRPCRCEGPDEEREREAAQAPRDLAAWYDLAPRRTAAAPASEAQPSPSALIAPPPAPAEPRGLDVEGLAPAGKVIVIGGRGRAGKSYLWRSLVTADGLALGRYGVRGRGPVVLVVGQSDGYEDVRRWIATLSDPDRYILAPAGTRINTPEGQAAIRSLVERHSAACLVVDSARSCSSGDEDSSRDTSAVMEYLASLRVTVLLVHHARKGRREGEDPLDILRGSGAWGDGADVVLLVRRHGRENCSTVHPIAKRVPPESLARPYIMERQPEWLAHWVEDYDPEGARRQRLLRLVERLGTVTVDSLVRESGRYYRPDEAREILEALAEEGLLVEAEPGYAWTTPTGQERTQAQAREDEARAGPIAEWLLGCPESAELVLALAPAHAYRTREDVGRSLDVSAETMSRRLDELVEALQQAPEPIRGAILIETRRGAGGGIRLTALGRAAAQALRALRAQRDQDAEGLDAPGG